MRRRKFIGAVTTFVMAGGWGSNAAHAAMERIDAGAADEAAALADHLLQAFPQPKSLQVIGDVYRRDLADDATACRVCMSDAFQGILRHLELSKAELRGMTPAAVRSRIDTGTARDFSEGRIISVDGWLLGETEARLCEVAALRTG